jgi:hypothetical protein
MVTNTVFAKVNGAGIAVVQFAYYAVEAISCIAEVIGTQVVVVTNDRVMITLAGQAEIRCAGVAVIFFTDGSVTANPAGA